MNLAINAAKIKHTLQNVKYDEMHDMQMEKEIKVVRMTVGLPIGSKYTLNLFLVTAGRSH